MLKKKMWLVFVVMIMIITSQKAYAADVGYNQTVCGSIIGKTGSSANVLWICNHNNEDWPNCIATQGCSTSTYYCWDQTNSPCSTSGGGSSSNNKYDPFDGCTNNEINTAVGCVPVGMSAFVTWLMKWLFGIAGGIAFLLMVYGFILIATSSGDEKKIQGAKETITSAIIGLLVCVFSVFILRLIAVNILQIPGL